MRKTVATILAAGVLGGAFLAGYLAMKGGAVRGWPAAAASWGTASRAASAETERPGRPAASPDRPEDEAVAGFVVLTEVMPFHPDWGELTSLTTEVEREQRSLLLEQAAAAEIKKRAGAGQAAGEAYQATMAEIDQARRAGQDQASATLKSTYERRWENERARLDREFEEAVAARRAVLAAQLDEQIAVKRGELKAALTDRVDQIRREREARLLSLQLKLALVEKDASADGQALELQEELSEVQAEVDRLIKEAQKESEGELAAYVREREAAAAQELKEFAAEKAAEAARKGEEVRRKLDAELAGRLAGLDEASGFQAAGGPKRIAQPVPASPSVQAPTSLQLRRNALHARIIAEIRRAAASAAKRHGLGAPLMVGTGAERPAQGMDLTEEVAQSLRAAEGVSGS